MKRRDFLAISLGLAILPNETIEQKKAKLTEALKKHYDDFYQSDEESRDYYLKGWNELTEKKKKEGRTKAYLFIKKTIRDLEKISTFNGGQMI